MNLYKNLSGKSGITHYKMGRDYIELKFRESKETYIYTNSMIGKERVDFMKMLAIEGRGLATYIAKNPDVKNNYQLR